MVDQVHIPGLLLSHLHMQGVEAEQREGGYLLFSWGERERERDVSSGFPNMDTAGPV